MLPFRILGVDHVVLRCADQSRALQFYTEVLGCREERRLEAIGLVQLRAGSSLIDLVPGDPTPSRDAPNLEHYCLATDTDDVDALVAHLLSCGVELLGDPMVRYGAGGLGVSVYCRDPEGNVVELKCAATVAAS